MPEQEPITWRLKDVLFTPRFPMVMGILNATPDSFFSGSRVDVDGALRLIDKMLRDGAGILDIGGQSSRPGSVALDAKEEMMRVLPVIEAVHRRFPQALISVDTWHAAVAEQAVGAGARMVNDITAGTGDPGMLDTVAHLAVPYVVMHMQGTPTTMQDDPRYADVAAEVTHYLSGRLKAAHRAGIADVILDPGFGFGKTTEHNHTLLRELPRICALGHPVLVGLSRKRMINEVLGTSAADALNGTTVLNTLALTRGASILRVHDVKEAVECVRLMEAGSGGGQWQ